jgi:hypothetical protein
VAIAALSTKNPYFIQRELDWVMMRDAYGGERYIKEKGQEYLPATSSMIQDGMGFGQPGFAQYQRVSGARRLSRARQAGALRRSWCDAPQGTAH